MLYIPLVEVEENRTTFLFNFFSYDLWARSFCRFAVCFVVRTTGEPTEWRPWTDTGTDMGVTQWSLTVFLPEARFSDGHTYRIVYFETHPFHASVMFPTQEICSMVYIALQFGILCYLIKMYRAVLQLGMNHQQLTEARDRSNCERINDRADPHIRYATEHDEREGWVSVHVLMKSCLDKKVSHLFSAFIWSMNSRTESRVK